ncbi:MAG TPA: 50S ribosomal protein L22 [Candidatus Paceibacterota bacterium]|nr:50S ribosomal protein L22 [Candidatus Paceibacterota bacterium]
MKATLTNYHQPPRKVRLVADLIRGKSVPAAKVALMFLDKKSAPALVKLLDSAVSNARFAHETVEVDALYIKSLTVDKGVTLKRVRPFKQGRAGRIHKIMSTVKLELGHAAAKAPAGKASQSVVAKQVEKTEDKIEKKVAVKPRAKKVPKTVNKK